MKEGKWHRTIVVEDELWERWHLACVAHKVSMSDAIRQSITQQLMEWSSQARGQTKAPTLPKMYARYGQLIDRYFLQGHLTSEDAQEVQALAAQLDAGEREIYEPILARLREGLARMDAQREG